MAKNDASDIERREETILGKPPRLKPLNTPEAIEQGRQLTASLRAAATGDTSPVEDADIPEMLLSLLCHADLYEQVANVSLEMMLKGTLPMRDRELAILRTGWLWQAPYEWGEHVALAKRIGISSEEIERVTEGSSAAGWSEHEAALLRAVEELHGDAMISDKSWDTLAKSYEDKQLYELTVLVGQFTLVAFFQNSLRLKLSGWNEGLKAR